MDLSELQALKANLPAVDDFLFEQPAVRDYKRQLEVIRVESVAAARRLLDQEAVVTAALAQRDRGRVALAQRRGVVESLLAERRELAARQAQALPRAAAKLEVGARKADESGEAFLGQVLDDETALDEEAVAEFRRKYLLDKMLKHQRLGMRERLR